MPAAVVRERYVGSRAVAVFDAGDLIGYVVGVRRCTVHRIEQGGSIPQGVIRIRRRSIQGVGDRGQPV